MAIYPKPGNTVPISGIYKVIHFPAHKQPHEIKCVKGNIFPPCGECRETNYVFVRPEEKSDVPEGKGTHTFFNPPP